MYKRDEHPSNNLGVYAVKPAIFAAIRPQFDDGEIRFSELGV